MKEFEKNFTCYGNINTLTKDEELLNYAKDAGCRNWIIGLESIDQQTINHIGKTANIVKKYKEGIKKIHKYGMKVTGLFMFGFDSDTNSVFRDTLDAIYSMNLDKAGFSILTPFPGTILFDELEKQKRIITKNWGKYNLKNAVFQPKNMTPEELEANTYDIMKEFYSFPNSFKRAINDKNASAKDFFMNLLYDLNSKRFYQTFGY